KALGEARLLEGGKGRSFYAIGGTWRALARLHMWQKGYPLHVMHGYVVPGREAYEFSGIVHRVGTETLSQIEAGGGCPPPALVLRGAGAGTSDRHGASQGDRDLGTRRARGPALFDA